MIGRRILPHQIWVCTVCICPTKRMLGLYGLTNIFYKTTGYYLFSSASILTLLLSIFPLKIMSSTFTSAAPMHFRLDFFMRANNLDPGPDLTAAFFAL